jgi:hypothetical protein
LTGRQHKLSVADTEFLAQEIRLSPAAVEEMTKLIVSGQ